MGKRRLGVEQVSKLRRQPVRKGASSMTYLFTYAGACVRAKSIQSCPTLCHPMDCGPPSSSVHGILQARIPEWSGLPCLPPGDLPDSGIKPKSSLLHWQMDSLPGATWEAPQVQILLIYSAEVCQLSAACQILTDELTGVTSGASHSPARVALQ